MLPARPFILCRHGETEMNAVQITCGGGVDTVLTQTGRDQASVAGKLLAQVPQTEQPTLIIHSDMSRSRETAGIINNYLNVRMIGNNDLREQMMGIFEGRPWAEAFPVLHTNGDIPGGEQMDVFTKRVHSAMQTVLNNYADERIMVVAHGGTFHALKHLYGADRRNMFVQNAIPHAWDPAPHQNPLPWEISIWHQPDGTNTVARTPAPICPRNMGKA